MNVTYQRIRGTQHDVKRYAQGKGKCAWCGQERCRTYDYRGPMALDYRLDRPTHQFCNRECFEAYHG